MPEELQSLNIAISGVEDTGPQLKIRDQNKRTYSFFKEKKDGGETVAYQDFRNFKIGDTVLITYKEVPFKDGTIRNAVNFKAPTGPPELAPITATAQFRARGSTSAGNKPTREYWEKREAKRQSSILMQVAFKSAVALEAARIQVGAEQDKSRLYSEALEFYDWMADQIVDGQESRAPYNASQSAAPKGEELGTEEDLGF